MKIQAIDSELWWVANADEIGSPKSYGLKETLQIIQEAFHFFTIPTSIPPASEGFSFQQGNLSDGEDKIVIRQLTIFNSGAHIVVAGNSSGADRVFQKLVEVFQTLGVREPVTPPLKFYRSHIVCDFEKPIEALFANYQKIIDILQGRTSIAEAKMHETGITFSADPTTLPANVAALNPTMFHMNRKTDVSFSINRYVCFANMATDEHLAALSEIERLLWSV
jgi:hypothetical protein